MPDAFFLSDKLFADVIAPCGMDCRLCVAFQRERKPCAGCLGSDMDKPKHCVQCAIKDCPEHTGGEEIHCCFCDKYPCPRLRRLDVRYRMKYGMSMVENLEEIKKSGAMAFANSNAERWTCPSCGKLLCVHQKNCPHCERERG
ncbi:MAG: DUF3795 domain-containing protein [Sphaerochaetaceae bacterium]|nr:DUF3795 domain-containing protein [Sphaerochaetaceae bacterium]